MLQTACGDHGIPAGQPVADCLFGVSPACSSIFVPLLTTCQAHGIGYNIARIYNPDVTAGTEVIMMSTIVQEPCSTACRQSCASVKCSRHGPARTSRE